MSQWIVSSRISLCENQLSHQEEVKKSINTVKKFSGSSNKAYSVYDFYCVLNANKIISANYFLFGSFSWLKNPGANNNTKQCKY